MRFIVLLFILTQILGCSQKVLYHENGRYDCPRLTSPESVKLVNYGRSFVLPDNESSTMILVATLTARQLEKLDSYLSSRETMRKFASNLGGEYVLEKIIPTQITHSGVSTVGRGSFSSRYEYKVPATDIEWSIYRGGTIGCVERRTSKSYYLSSEGLIRELKKGSSE